MGEMERDMDVLRKARKSSLMSQSEFADRMQAKLGRTASVPTIVEWEKHPDQVTIMTLHDYYSLCGTDAKAWIREFVDSFFCPEC